MSRVHTYRIVRSQLQQLHAVFYQAAEIPVRVASSPDVKIHEVTPNGSL